VDILIAVILVAWAIFWTSVFVDALRQTRRTAAATSLIGRELESLKRAAAEQNMHARRLVDLAREECLRARELPEEPEAVQQAFGATGA